MPKLIHTQKKQVLVPQLKKAEGFFQRAKGLIGKKDISEFEGMFFDRCNSIHTCFMSMSIDCVFCDGNMNVLAIFQNVKPWRLVGPIWKAKNVIEVKSGQVKNWQIQVGDHLYVGN